MQKPIYVCENLMLVVRHNVWVPEQGCGLSRVRSERIYSNFQYSSFLREMKFREQNFDLTSYQQLERNASA
jgi:hypothetical protein